MNLFKGGALLIGLMARVSACALFGDINQDPDAATVSTVQALIPSAQARIACVLHGRV